MFDVNLRWNGFHAVAFRKQNRGFTLKQKKTPKGVFFLRIEATRMRTTLHIAT
ncbi:hypothetical protein J2S17_000326 [Cytobacillus purgationiresistens]|uniref:Uncharacterized protein n=1 Tax=Cytobacillus purgationiresistens TaxID=863449 RepID=A0ABU0AB32_9BACI|nr:hypothetical protein [Cytobacillus purgationiresistens]